MCAPGAPPAASAFDDNNPCTTDSCNPARGGIVNDLVAGCSSNAGAPPLDSTAPSSFADSVEFLYSGASPVQTGVVPGTIDTSRTGVVRGRVLASDGVTPAVGATVTILGHPELGQTLTRTGGWYDLAVNGGATYTVDITLSGFLRLQRQARAKALGYFNVDDVVLTAPFMAAEKFVPGAAVAKVVRGSTTPAGTDADPARRATLYFPPSTRTTNFAVADGTPLDVQVTELTVAGGVRRMPGDLPPSSGYTYAVEVGIPSAAAAGVQDVRFDKDVVLYVSNFTGYPVGTNVPLGYYDRTKGAWLTERTGRIIKILTAPAGGQATVDISGDAVAETPAALDAFGLVAAERTMLAAEYPAGTTLWRSAVPHFSVWDCNWPFGPPPNAPAPPDPEPDDGDPDDPCEREGSIIGCESRTLGERLPLFGTPFSLHYQSERAEGFRNVLRIPVTDATVLPPSLQRVHITIEAGGRVYHYTREAPVAANDRLTWTWDGTDAYGRQVRQGTVEATIRVGFEYSASPTYSATMVGEAAANGVVLGGNRNARTVTLWKERSRTLRVAQAKPLGFGGWTLDAHHELLGRSTLALGSGRRRELARSAVDYLVDYLVDSVAGGGSPAAFGDGAAATSAYLGTLNDFGVKGDGALIIAHDGGNTLGGRIRRVDAGGIIQTIAGLTPVVVRSASSDGSPALNAQVFATSTALLGDGAIVFAEVNKNLLWKIDSAGTLRRVAGTSAVTTIGECDVAPFCGDGGPATAASIGTPTSVVAAADGALYVADSGHLRIRRIGPEGTISTYWKSTSTYPLALSLRADGTLVAPLADGSLLRIEPYGLAALVKEPGGATSSLTSPTTGWCPSAGTSFLRVLLLRDDTYLVTCYSQIFLRSPAGIVTCLAGPPANATYGYAGDGGPALRALFAQMAPVVIGPRNELFVADGGSGRIRRLRTPSAAAGGAGVLNGVLNVPSEDGSEIFEFSPAGRHTRTRTALRGATRFAFGYDGATGQLTSVTDEANNITSITRTASLVTITSPYGQATKLNLDANGFVASVVNPVAAETTQVAHTSTGLLTDLVNPKGYAHHFEYGVDGRLTKDVDATPGSLGTRLLATSSATSYAVEITSPEGRVTRHEVSKNQSFGDRAIVERRRITNAIGLTTVSDKSVDDALAITRPDGTITTVQETATDPRWGGLATYPKKRLTQVGTRAMTRDETRSATLATAGDPFSVTAQTIASTLSGTGVTTATTTRTFAAGPPSTWTTTSGAGRQTRETLDSLDRVTKTEILGSSPVTLNPVVYSYDTRGRVSSVTWGTRVYGTTYNATSGWVDSTTAPAALGVTYTSRDANGRATVTTLPGSRTLATSYDLAGNLVSVTPPSQPAHLFGFDPNDRLASYGPPNLIPTLSPKDTLYAWDRDGLQVLANHPGKPVTFSYDQLGRLSRRVDAVTTTQAYDTQGRLATVSTSDGVLVTNTYDGTLLTQQATSGPFAHAVNKTYDNFLRVASWNVDGTSPIALTYDGDNLITAAGGMTVTRSTNGLLTAVALGVRSETWGYNAYGEVTSHAASGSATAFSVTTTRDAAGRIDVRTETIGTTTTSYRYAYDTAGRLAAVYVNGAATPTRAWTYDGNGNRDGATYDDQDRLTAFGGAVYTYGNNGELATKVLAGATTSYSYDANGNLRGVTRPAGGPITYVIDGQNRRVGKKVSAALVQGFLYDGARVVAELGSTGAEVARFVYATGSHSPDYMVKGGLTYLFVKDHLGSPRLVVKTSDGTIAQRLDYDEWGVVTNDTNAGFQPFGFAGGIYDRDTQLVRFGARDYDASVGRWTTKDRARLRGGLNFYAYCNDDPINLVDPSGYYAGSAAVVVATAVAGPTAVVFAVGATIAALAGATIAHDIFEYTHPSTNPSDPGTAPTPAPPPGPGPGPSPAPGPGPGPGPGDLTPGNGPTNAPVCGPYRLPGNPNPPDPADCAREALQWIDQCKQRRPFEWCVNAGDIIYRNCLRR